MKITKEELISSLTRFAREHGRYPSKSECRDIEWLYGWNTYWRELGPQSELTLLEDVYNENPSLCTYCKSSLPYSKRSNKYCNQSCAASFNNHLRREECRKTCVECNTPLNKNSSTYCSNSCQAAHGFKLRLNEWLASGKTFSNRIIRKFLEEMDGYKCSVCGVSEWQSKPITLEVEHKDGDSEDSSYENVCLICPNCHSQTDTYKGKNKGKGRYSRMQRYREGRSY